MTSVGVVVTIAGRRDHLARQLTGLQRQHQLADQLVLVRMDDLGVLVPAGAAHGWQLADVPHDGRLPLAAARNAGVRALSTDVVVLLDVDCIPGAGLVAGYAAAARAVPGLLCGSLRYLEPGVPQGSWQELDLVAGSRPHPARPSPAPGTLVRQDRYELAWTTSLAMRREIFASIGGFDERFAGYGGEDTDFAFRAKAAGFGVWWTGDAIAYHQHHPSQNPPRQHLDDIVRNAALFAAIHGWYPMSGWLEAFQREGLIDFDPAAGLLRLSRARSADAPRPVPRPGRAGRVRPGSPR